MPGVFTRSLAARADDAAADLQARILEDVALAGVEAEVEPVSGRCLQVTLTRLPPGAVASTPAGLAPTAHGARITGRLHDLARRACDQAGITRPTVFRIRPSALSASSSSTPARKAS